MSFGSGACIFANMLAPVGLGDIVPGTIILGQQARSPAASWAKLARKIFGAPSTGFYTVARVSLLSY